MHLHNLQYPRPSVKSSVLCHLSSSVIFRHLPLFFVFPAHSKPSFFFLSSSSTFNHLQNVFTDEVQISLEEGLNYCGLTSAAALRHYGIVQTGGDKWHTTFQLAAKYGGCSRRIDCIFSGMTSQNINLSFNHKYFTYRSKKKERKKPQRNKYFSRKNNISGNQNSCTIALRRCEKERLRWNMSARQTTTPRRRPRGKSVQNKTGRCVSSLFGVEAIEYYLLVKGILEGPGGKREGHHLLRGIWGRWPTVNRWNENCPPAT